MKMGLFIAHDLQVPGSQPSKVQVRVSNWGRILERVNSEITAAGEQGSAFS
jgi:hypothetical protein